MIWIAADPNRIGVATQEIGIPIDIVQQLDGRQGFRHHLGSFWLYADEVGRWWPTGAGDGYRDVGGAFELGEGGEHRGSESSSRHRFGLPVSS